MGRHLPAAIRVAIVALAIAYSGIELRPPTQYISSPMADVQAMESCVNPEFAAPGLLMVGNGIPGMPAPTRAFAAGAPLSNPQPVRTIHDPYPVFAGIAVDSVNNKVVVADQNTFKLFVYDRDMAGGGVVKPRTSVGGPKTRLLFITAVDVDPDAQEMYTINNDIMDDVVTFKYTQDGDVTPVRELKVDHGSWGISLDRKNRELAVTTQHVNKLAVYPQGSTGATKALRVIQGPITELADPHGVFIDNKNDEILVTNHGSWHSVRGGDDEEEARPAAPRTLTFAPLQPSTGRFLLPSITIYGRTASGNVAPIRTIQGEKTGLNQPLNLLVDMERDEIIVANDSSNSILVFDRKANGNVAPKRSINGAATGLKNPAGVSMDWERDQLWVSNWGNRTITVYPRAAKGNVTPVKTLNAAPVGEPMAGLGNNGAITYDASREQILVPN